MTLSEAKALFGLGDGYTLQEAKSARNRLAKRYHPDVNDDLQAEEILKRIIEAYQLLVDSFDEEQERMRAKKAEEERKRRSTKQERYSRQARSEHHASNEEQQQQAEQERQRQAAERQWRQRTEEARRDRAEQSRRQRERWEAMQRERARQEAAQREQEHLERERLERERQEAARREQERLERDYQKACDEAKSAKTSEDFKRVAELFDALGNYRDSEQQSINLFLHGTKLATEEQFAAEQKEKLEREAEYRKYYLVSIVAATVTSIVSSLYAYPNADPLHFLLAALMSGSERAMKILVIMLFITVPAPLSCIKSLLALAKGQDDYVDYEIYSGQKTGITCLICVLFLFWRNKSGLLTVSLIASAISCLFACNNNTRQALKITFACISFALLAAYFILLSTN